MEQAYGTRGFRALGDPEVDRTSEIVMATATAAAGAATGRIDDVWFFDGPLGKWVSYNSLAQPPIIPINTELVIAINWLNIGTEVLVGHVEFTITKPDSSVVTPEAAFNQDKSASPGDGGLVFFGGVVLDQTGTYAASVTLSSGGVTLDTLVFDCAVVGVSGVAGEIWQYGFWNPSTGEHQPTAPTITIGQEAGVVGLWTNTGQYVQNMWLVVVVKAPDGTEMTFTGAPLETGVGYTLWQHFTWVCDQVGQYEVTITLYGELA